MNFRLLGFAPAIAAVISALPASVFAEPNAGAYLAARQAAVDYAFEEAETYYNNAIIADPTNLLLLESQLFSLVGQNNFADAQTYAQALVSLDAPSQIAHIVLAVNNIARADWAAVSAAMEGGQTISPLIDGTLQGWAAIGEGRMSDALANFDAMIEDRSLSAFGYYQKALALAYVGDFEGAEAILSSTESGGLVRMVRARVAHAQILSQLGRPEDALAALQGAEGFQDDPTVRDLRDRITAGETVPFNLIASPAAGAAEMFLSVAVFLQDEADANYKIVYSRAAQTLDPTSTEAMIISAALLEELGRHDMASAAYAQVPQDSPNYLNAEMGRANTLVQSGQNEAAIEVLRGLTKDFPDQGYVFATLGDNLRRSDDMAGADAAYTTAIDLAEDGDSTLWFLHYARGIAREQLKQWEGAESDFRTSLELQPGHPSVLNYLGYSLVERRENLDEALAMIEQAAQIDPENGAIIDSLGWVLFRLGRYDESIVHMERAVELLPVDPILNDHLGDVLWAVDRKTEARFQWQRALSFDPEPTEAERIRRKLDIGLDAVLVDEGANLLVTDDGNN